MEVKKRFCELALSFPTLRFCPGLLCALQNEPPDEASQTILKCLDQWLETDIGMAERQAALFMLNLWTRGPWPPFDLFEALGAWDHHHQNAFAAWAKAPWRP